VSRGAAPARILALAVFAAAWPLRAQDVPPAAAPQPASPAAAPHALPPAAAPHPVPPASAPESVPPAQGAQGALAQDLQSLVLQPGEIARIAGLAVLRDEDFDRYLGTVYARLPEGDAALTQLAGEALIEHDAAAAGIVATEADVDASIAALDEAVRAAAGNHGKGFEESVTAGVSKAQMREAVRRLVLHERLVRAADGLPAEAPVKPERLKAWLDARLAGAKLQAASLDDPLAAVFDGGSLSKAEIGARLRSVLAPQVQTGVLTELIGVQLVRARANLLGVDLTNAAVTREILDRDAALQAQAGAQDVSYEQFVQTVQKRSLAELLTSDKFSAEVLLRELTERTFSETQARSFWEKNKPAFQAASKGKLGPGADWAAASPLVWRELRQRTYRALFEQSRIARRL